MLPGNSISKCAILADPRTREKSQLIGEVLKALIPKLESKGLAVESYVKVPADQIKPGPEVGLFLVLGGDGTMIHFTQHLGRFGIPFYGLNYGNMGFMMNSPTEGLDRHASNISEGEFTIWKFPVLKVKSTDLNGEVHEGYGLNDIYLQRMTAQSCRVNITLGETSLDINPLLCDGVIVATPLGSTAYSYNTTGSLVAIDASVITLTPLAAHRSCPVSCMMLPFDTRIEFHILEPEKRRVQVVSDAESHGNLTHAEILISKRHVMLCYDPEASRNLPMRFINKACGPSPKR